jgi:hypothetical protein
MRPSATLLAVTDQSSLHDDQLKERLGPVTPAQIMIKLLIWFNVYRMTCLRYALARIIYEKKVTQLEWSWLSPSDKIIINNSRAMPRMTTRGHGIILIS